MTDDGITCNCNPKGWKGEMPVPLDGNSWPVEFAAKMIGCSERDLRDMIRVFGIEPAGALKMSSYRRSGRHPRAYNASLLVEMWDDVQALGRKLRGE